MQALEIYLMLVYAPATVCACVSRKLKQLSRTKPPPVQVRPHFTEFEYTMLVTETLLSIRKPVIFVLA